MVERERQHLVPGPEQHRVLGGDQLAQAYLSPLVRLAQRLPAGRPELPAQTHTDVVQAGGAVEIDEDRADRQHRTRVAFASWTTRNASRWGSWTRSASDGRACRAPRCSRSTGSCSRSRTWPIPRSTRWWSKESLRMRWARCVPQRRSSPVEG